MRCVRPRTRRVLLPQLHLLPLLLPLLLAAEPPHRHPGVLPQASDAQQQVPDGRRWHLRHAIGHCWSSLRTVIHSCCFRVEKNCFPQIGFLFSSLVAPGLLCTRHISNVCHFHFSFFQLLISRCCLFLFSGWKSLSPVLFLFLSFPIGFRLYRFKHPPALRTRICLNICCSIFSLLILICVCGLGC